MTDPNYLFCKIAAGHIPADKVFEDDRVLAFLDINPNNPGHALVILREHHENVFDMPKAEFAELMTYGKKVAEAVKRSGLAEVVFIAMNNGAAAGQIVPHAHVAPRLSADGLRHWPGHPYQEDEAATVTEKIKNAFFK